MKISDKIFSIMNFSVTLNLFQGLETYALNPNQIPKQACLTDRQVRNDNYYVISFMKMLLFLTVMLLLVFPAKNYSQQKEEVRLSPKALVEQTVGFTEVTIDYSRPGVKGRKIWGGLVPYNVVWRAGANEATKITFSTDVKIDGKKLKAGSYGFFAIPGQKTWILIFNKVANQWGAFEYNDVEDALRIEVTPMQNNCWQEWLAYSINKSSDNKAVVMLEWEKLKVPFNVEVEI